MSDRTHTEALANVVYAAERWIENQMRWPADTVARKRQDRQIAELQDDIATIRGLPRIEFTNEQLPDEIDDQPGMCVSIPTELLGDMAAPPGNATAVFTGVIDDTDPDTRIVRSMRLLRIEIQDPV